MYRFNWFVAMAWIALAIFLLGAVHPTHDPEHIPYQTDIP